MPRDLDIEEQDRSPFEARRDDAGSPPASATDRTAQARAKGRFRGARRAALGVAALLVAGAAGWYGYDWWTVGRFLVSTDDAYVKADYAIMAARVAGYAAAVPAVENGPVRAGDPLVRLDDGDFRNALASAEAALEAQRATVERSRREIDAARAAVAQAEARRASAQAVLAQAEADFARYERLAESDFASGQRLDAARAARDTARAAVAEVEAAVTAARTQVAVAEARLREAEAAIAGLEAARDQARRDLDATVIRAPFDGVVGNLSVAKGEYVTPGKRLLAVVPLDGVYVDANFKETQLARLTVGAPATLEVDAFPGRAITGRVESFSPASGSIFSLLPPENATGNFTKVVQRVPVRISVPPEAARQGWLRPGMSVVATVDVRGDAPAE